MFLLVVNLLLLVVGMFIETSAAILVLAPILAPIAIAYGVDPVHFGLIVTLNLAIGQQTPPVASVLITSCSIAKADIWETTKVNIHFIAVLLAVLLICTYVRAVPMFLVDLIYGKP